MQKGYKKIIQSVKYIKKYILTKLFHHMERLTIENAERLLKKDLIEHNDYLQKYIPQIKDYEHLNKFLLLAFEAGWRKASSYSQATEQTLQNSKKENYYEYLGWSPKKEWNTSIIDNLLSSLQIPKHNKNINYRQKDKKHQNNRIKKITSR